MYQKKRSKKVLTAKKQFVNGNKAPNRKEEIQGILFNHEDVIRYFISIYQKGYMGEKMKTYKSHLARFLAEKGLLVYIENGECKSLSERSIATYISTISREDRKPRNYQDKKPE